MIIKGASRAGPKQLAAHLNRADTNERIELLELQSPAENLREAFRDWQTLSEGTKGRLGLYHANIDPAEDYTMTPAQWARAADVLEEELGLVGQPRAIVLHKKHGREHAHVVWARTDIDTMTLRSDGHNYQAHERASQRLEIEFGHEIVPGRHTKRDREKQPEIPQAQVSHAEWQQAERTGTDPRVRKEEIRHLWESSDSASAFAAALADAGYVLARGDRRDFILVDRQGETYSLGRDAGVRAAELRAFMAPIGRDALPDEAAARALQAERARAEELARAKVPAAPVQEQEPGPDLAARRAEIAARHAEALAALEVEQGRAVTALRDRQNAEMDTAIDSLVRAQAKEAVAVRPVEPDLWQKVKEAFSEREREERLAAAARRRAVLEEAHREQTRMAIGEIQGRHKDELVALAESQALELAALKQAQEQEMARRMREAERAVQIAAEFERRRQEALSRDQEGPERDGRAR